MEAGYTDDITKAGRYTLEDAERICKQANHYLRPGEQLNEIYFPVDATTMQDEQ